MLSVATDMVIQGTQIKYLESNVICGRWANGNGVVGGKKIIEHLYMSGTSFVLSAPLQGET